MTAVFCRNAADRKAATWEGQLAPFTRLEFAVSDGAKGIAAAVASRAEARRRRPIGPGRWSTGWTSSTRPARRSGSWPLTGGAPRRPGSRPRRPTPWSPRRSGKGSMRGAGPGRDGPRRVAAGAGGAGAGRAAGSGLGPGRRGAGAVRPRRPAQRPRRRRGRDRRGARGVDRPRLVEGPQRPGSTVGAWRSWTGCTAGWRRPSRGREWREAMAWRWWLRHRRAGRRRTR